MRARTRAAERGFHRDIVVNLFLDTTAVALRQESGRCRGHLVRIEIPAVPAECPTTKFPQQAGVCLELQRRGAGDADALDEPSPRQKLGQIMRLSGGDPVKLEMTQCLRGALII